MNTQMIIEVRQLADAALALANDENWGSEDQINAENAFAAKVNSLLSDRQQEEWESYCLNATAEEIVHSGLQMLFSDDSYSKTLWQIQQWQNVQMTHNSKSAEWLEASEKLQPLFAHMAEITKSN